MLLQDFFSYISSSSFGDTPKVTKLPIDEKSSSLFGTLIRKKCKEKFDKQINFIDVSTIDINELKSILETTFLGQSYIYWLSNIINLNENNSKILIKYLDGYTGPHSIIYCKPVEDLPFGVDKSSYQIINSFFLDQTKEKGIIDPNFIEKLFSIKRTITLNEAILFINYQSLLGRRWADFFSSWVDKIIENEASLFTLSQYFFSKNSSVFFNLWNQVREIYPDEFWVAYWSDQLWHAIFFINYMRLSMLKEAKSINRLPFAFIQKDWKKCNFSELQNAHKFLYKIDYNLKNGTVSNAIELWIFKYFDNQF